MLENIKSPKDLKSIPEEELNTLAKEIREKIISTVAKNGGHLASNLGIVEATIALHRVFDAPNDKIVFDVSHQCYAHKLLTGRYQNFGTLRKHNGISGFTNPDESIYDTFIAGHSGTSLSSALGIAKAFKLQNKDNYAIAVIGDGSFTNGMAYEALNNCAGDNLNLIILLNDNEMSISKNVGGMHHNLSKIRTSKRYFAFKRVLKKVCLSIPFIGRVLVCAVRGIRNFFKRIIVKYNIFESLGCDYIGPVDGNNIKKLEDALAEAKSKHRCSVVHIITKKGKGYAPAEAFPESYHSTPVFDTENGVKIQAQDDFSAKFGKYMCELAKKDERICAISAAMIDGTGLKDFQMSFPDRFFDTAIAEEHAATFAAGLAKAGLKPVFALYSTFAQRIYDQVYHDSALQRLNVVFALDRAGIVGADGATHQGLYDYSLFSGIPGINIYSPETYAELRQCLDKALTCNSASIVRYPRGKELTYDRSNYISLDTMTLLKNEAPDVTIVTYGIINENAHKASQVLKELGIGVQIIKLVRIMPLDTRQILSLIGTSKLVYLLEEGIKSGSVAEKIAASMKESTNMCDVIINAIDNTFVAHGSRDELLSDYGLDASKIAKDIYDYLITKKSIKK